MQVFERVSLAVRKPELVLRKLQGKEPVAIELHEIARYLPDSPVILEAGACDGTDTVKIAQYWPRATVYAFEPVPELFVETERRTSHLPNVRCYPFALSERTGSAEMHVSSGSNRGDSSSLLAPAEHLTEYENVKFTRSIDVQTVTLDDWARTEDVSKIDFMWLDMQGMELPTLKAAGTVLATTSAICMEVARKELYAGCAMYDEIVSWMTGQGFRPAIDRVATSDGNILFTRS